MAELDGLGYRDRTVVVTGCTSGMGQAVAEILGELGARVHAVGRREPSVTHAAFYPTDLAEPEQIVSTAEVLGQVGPIDYLFNCAGVPHMIGGPLHCMLVNYIGTRFLTERLLASLADGAGIANVASNAGMGWQRRLPDILDLLAVNDPVQARAWCEQHMDVVADGYSLSKETLIVWTLRQAVTWGHERGIRATCIAPGPTRTAFMDEAVRDMGQAFFDRLPYPTLGRMTTPQEQAWPMILLNSPLNVAGSGNVLYTDQAVAGGMLTGMIDTSVFRRDPVEETAT
ncbi:NAD(P)-dependent dehydrogenase, short-chain alcohol dehydrogenase family [Parafrankia irregularis]|uniref:NAD(P)-dependent dehydrogenase, short-chain alcohol dehydrogenase family n=1 Tax=Parafrankia irregularis TaxID=795642 RepID=A0A0S4R0H8_9ACTN|nr:MULTISPECIES: SDR family NAD(P)-dependent oxidoreductase [Parafrankia]MBE3203525.1 SDR family NAD(P)-dependent oxidoreductase [Parafrankia sp. CH37]CUU60969.1 NAD(P)-dependent dehydrogenase, short-chain alcohol dehydrogenase family [Parafrankia irregularis]